MPAAGIYAGVSMDGAPGHPGRKPAATYAAPRSSRSGAAHATMPTTGPPSRTAAPRAFSSRLSVSDGDIAAEVVSDYPGFDPAVTGLPLRRHLSPPWATFSLAAWARAIPIARSTRQCGCSCAAGAGYLSTRAAIRPLWCRWSSLAGRLAGAGTPCRAVESGCGSGRGGTRAQGFMTAARRGCSCWLPVAVRGVELTHARGRARRLGLLAAHPGGPRAARGGGC